MSDIDRINRQLIDEEPDIDPDYQKKFNSIHDMNKPWAFEKSPGQFFNFECTDCIQLELGYFIYEKNSASHKYCKTEIVMGEVDFTEMTITVKNDNGDSEKFRVQRS